MRNKVLFRVAATRPSRSIRGATRQFQLSFVYIQVISAIPRRHSYGRLLEIYESRT